MAKQPEYRLQVLLEIRQRHKDEAEKALGAAVAAHRAELEKQTQMEAELARMVQKREQRRRDYAEKAMRGEMAAREVAGAQTYLERLEEQEEVQKNAIEAQKDVVVGKQRDVDAARATLVKANQDLKALEKHKEKAVAEWKKEVQAKEDEAMDEVAQQIFLKGERL
jgi:flagellar export protein FliJ